MKGFAKFSIAFLASIGVATTTVLTVNQNQTIKESASAAAHINNYDDYTYSGTYYNGINFNAGDGMNGALRQALTDLIEPASTPSYGGTGSWSLSTTLQKADQDPTNSSNMVYLYTRNSVTKKAANPSSTWNREHVWAKSLSNNCWVESNAGSDLLHLRPTYEETNSKRGNDRYGYVADTTWLKTQKMVTGLTYGKSGGGIFEPVDASKGDVARICMYVWVAWYDFYGASKIPDITKVFTSYDTLMEWHMSDLPDQLEGKRNDYAQSSQQKNRNPFVDHPELAWKIFGSKCSAAIKEKAQNVYPDSTAKKVNTLTVSGTPTTKVYKDGQTFNPAGITVTANYTDGTTENVTNKVFWKKLSYGTSYAIGYYGGKSVTVNGLTIEQFIKLLSISFKDSEVTGKPGDKVQLQVIFKPENAVNKKVTYTSLSTSVATVDINGLVTLKAEGTATIMARSEEGNYTTVCSVTVATPTSAFGCFGSVTSGCAIIAIVSFIGLGFLFLKKKANLQR